MRWKHGLRLVLLVLLAAAGGCKKNTNVFVPPPPPKVTIAQPIVQEVTDYRDYTGNASALESVDLRARVEGYLTSVNYKAGTVVKKDALLFVIDPRPYELAVQQAEAELESRKAQVTLHDATYRQYSEAKTRGASTEFELLTAKGRLDAAKAALLSSQAGLEKAKLDLSYTHVSAPFDGLINRTQVDVGNLVGSGQATVLATIVRIAPIYAYFSVGENDLLEFMTMGRERGTTDKRGVGLPVFLGLADEKGFPHEGKIDSVENKLDPNTGTITVRGIFPNSDQAVIAGAFVRIRLPLGKQKATLAPDVAISTDQSGQFVLVVNTQNMVEQRRIVPGKLYGEMRDIRSGLDAKEWVIINGLQRARVGAAVEPSRTTLPADSGAASSPASASSSRGLERGE